MTVMQESDLNQFVLELFNRFRVGMITVDELFKRLNEVGIYGQLFQDEKGAPDGKDRYAFILPKYMTIAPVRKGCEVKIWFEKEYWKGSVKAAIRYTLYEFVRQRDAEAKKGASDYLDMLEDDE